MIKMQQYKKTLKKAAGVSFIATFLLSVGAGCISKEDIKEENNELKYAEEKGLQPDVIEKITNYDTNTKLSETEKNLIDELSAYPEGEQKQVLEEIVGKELTQEDVQELKQFEKIYNQNREFAQGLLKNGITPYELEFMQDAYGLDKEFLAHYFSAYKDKEIGEEDLKILEKSSELYKTEKNQRILKELMAKNKLTLDILENFDTVKISEKYGIKDKIVDDGKVSLEEKREVEILSNIEKEFGANKASKVAENGVSSEEKEFYKKVLKLNPDLASKIIEDAGKEVNPNDVEWAEKILNLSKGNEQILVNLVKEGKLDKKYFSDDTLENVLGTGYSSDEKKEIIDIFLQDSKLTEDEEMVSNYLPKFNGKIGLNIVKNGITDQKLLDVIEKTYKGMGEREIKIDGKRDKFWPIEEIQAVTDPKGDNKGIRGADIKNVYAQMSSDYLYIMYEMYGYPISGNYNIGLDYNGDGDYEFVLGFSRDGAWVHNLVRVSNDEKWPDSKNISSISEFSVGEVAELKVPLSEIDNPKEIDLYPWLWVPSENIAPDEFNPPIIREYKPDQYRWVRRVRVGSSVFPELKETENNLLTLMESPETEFSLENGVFLIRGKIHYGGEKTEITYKDGVVGKMNGHPDYYKIFGDDYVDEGWDQNENGYFEVKSTTDRSKFEHGEEKSAGFLSRIDKVAFLDPDENGYFDVWMYREKKPREFANTPIQYWVYRDVDQDGDRDLRLTVKPSLSVLGLQTDSETAYLYEKWREIYRYTEEGVIKVFRDLGIF